jgi:hypothetical protein
MEQPVEIAKWVAGWAKTLPKTAKICIGNYTYLNGDLHVKLAIAADMVMTQLRAVRPDTAVAFLCTPTDYHVVTEGSYRAAKANYGWNHGGKLFEVSLSYLLFRLMFWSFCLGLVLSVLVLSGRVQSGLVFVGPRLSSLIISSLVSSSLVLPYLGYLERSYDGQ